MADDSGFMVVNNFDNQSFQKLQDFQYNGVNYLYNLEPQQNNLFMVDSFYDPYCVSEGKSSVDGTYGLAGGTTPTNIEYRIKKISGLQLPGLEIKTDYLNKAQRFFYVVKKENTNTIKIDWVEDAFWTVKRYHMNWMNSWYNKNLDCMVVGQSGKFRNLVWYLYHYVNINEDTATPIQKAMPIARFELKGLVPKSISEPNFEWGADSSTEATTVDYAYNVLEVYFYPFSKEDKAYIGGLADFIQGISGGGETSVTTSRSNVMNTGITGYTNSLQNVNPNGQFKEMFSSTGDAGAPARIYYI